MSKPNMTRTHSPERTMTSGASKRLAKNIASKPGLGKRKPSKPFNPKLVSEAEKDDEHSDPRITRHLRVLGMASLPNIPQFIGVAVKRKSGDRTPLIVPVSLLGTNKGAGAEEFLIRNGLGNPLLDQIKAKDFGPLLLRAAHGKLVTVIDKPGYYKFKSGVCEIAGYAWRNKFYHFGGDKPTVRILLIDEAAAATNTTGDVLSWNRAFRRYLIKNPRLLVAICFSLASALFSAFGRNGLVLALIADSSKGKSTIERLCASLIGDKKLVTAWDATRIGMQERLAGYSDQPTFLDDMHEADHVRDVLSLIMNIGNAAARIVSKRASIGVNLPAQTPIKTNLMLSSEEGLFSLASQGGTKVQLGISARYFEIHAGPQYGMFDDLCDYADGRELSIELDNLAGAFCGAVWTPWVAELSKRWAEVTAWHGELAPGIRDAILDAAGNPDCDEVTSRMVDSLAFTAFAGCVASKLGILTIQKKRTISSAFGQVLREHIARQPKEATTTSTRQNVIEAVRGYVQSHRSSFVDVSQYSKPDRKSGIPGFRVDDSKHGPLYLFIVESFKNRFEQKFGSAVYQHLRDGGYLVAHATRNNRFTKRVPWSGSPRGKRVDFIAVKADIEYVS